MAINGSQILILAETGSGTYESVAEQTTFSWEETADMIDVSSKDNAHKKYVAGQRDGTASQEGFYVPSDTAYQALRTAYKSGTEVIIRRSESGTEVEEAPALITTISGEAPTNEGSTMSIEYQLNDDWAEVTV